MTTLTLQLPRVKNFDAFMGIELVEDSMKGIKRKIL